MSSSPRETLRKDERRQRLLAEKKAAISARLQRVCEHLPREEFDRLVEQIALVEIKYMMRRSDDLFPPRDV